MKIVRNFHLFSRKLLWILGCGILFGIVIQDSPVGAETKVTRFPDGSVHSTMEVNALGLPHGIAREYLKDGTLVAEKQYQYGVREGLSRLFYPNGNLMTEWIYQNDKRNGISLGYYKNGRLKDRGFYRDDALEGNVYLYFPSGKPKAILSFKDNRQDGVSRTFYESGAVEFVYTYRKGQLLRRKRYDAQGNLALTQDFPEQMAPP